MYVGQDFDPIEPGETDAFTIDFTGDLSASQATIETAVWGCSVQSTLSGSTPDASPNGRLAGSATITNAYGKYMTSQLISGMTDGNNYILQATVTTSDGRTLQRYSHVFCRIAQ